MGGMIVHNSKHAIRRRINDFGLEVMCYMQMLGLIKGYYMYIWPINRVPVSVEDIGLGSFGFRGLFDWQAELQGDKCALVLHCVGSILRSSVSSNCG